MRIGSITLPWLLKQLRQTGLLSRIMRGAGITFTIQVAGVLLAYAAQVLLARWLGAAEYGKYSYAFSWAILLAVPAGLGLNVAVLRFIPQYRAKNELGLLRGVMKRSWQLALVAGIVAALLGCGAAIWLVPHQYSVSLMLGVWMVPLIALMNLHQGIARALRRITVAFAPPLVLRPLLLIIGVFALVLATSGEIDSQQALAVALVTLLVIVLVQGLVLLRSISPGIRAARSEYRSREWLRVAAPLLLSAGFGVLTAQMGILMVGTISGPSAAGVFSAAAKTALFVSFILVAVNALAAPTFASLHFQGKRDELQRLLVKMAHAIFWPSLAIAAVLAAFSGPVLGLFGQEFVAARWAMIVLIAGQLVNAGAGAVGNLTDLTGFQRQGAWVRGWSAVLGLLLNAALIPLYGVLGAAIATAASLALTNIWLHRLATRNLGVRPSILFALSRSRAPGA